MALQIKGDTNCFNKQQLGVIEKTLQGLNLKGKDVSVEPLGKAGDNFVADVRVIKVKMDNNEDLRIIVKIVPTSGVSAMGELTAIFFNNEIIMYTEVLPVMIQLQENAGFAKKDLYKYAKCFGASRERHQEILLLEDLTKYNYTMLDKFTPLTNECVKIVLSQLAEYHSLSYALKYKEPEKFAEFSNKLIEVNPFMDLDEHRQKMKMIGESFGAIFDKAKYQNVVRNAFTKEAAMKMKKVRDADAGSKYTILVHGDSWTNNILFQLENGVPASCILIDYQLCRQSLPVIDLLYLFFNCTDYETRAKYYYGWLDHYHAELEKSLFIFGLRINNVYPREKFDSDMIRYSRFNLGFSLITLSLLLRKNEESAKVKEAMAGKEDMDEIMDQMKLNEDALGNESILKIKHRVEGLIDSCFDFGLLSGL